MKLTWRRLFELLPLGVPAAKQRVGGEASSRIILSAVTCAGVVVGTAGNVWAVTYVVDQAAPGAADENPGTEEKPFNTVQHAADSAKPGDTVFVMAGKYDERVKVKTGGLEG